MSDSQYTNMQILRFVIGSVTGTARAAADTVRKQLEADFVVHSHEYDDLDGILIQPNQTLVFFIANTGAGELSPQMKRVYVQLTQRQYDLSGHQYLLLNFGDSRYKEFGAAGQRLDKALRERNATPLANILTLDAHNKNKTAIPLAQWIRSHL